MKKQILSTAVIISGILFSCTKEKIGTSQNQPLESNAASKNVTETSGQLSIPPIDPGLVGRFEFDGNLEDKSGQLPDGTSYGRGAVSYTSDRNGNAASALNMTGYYGINLKDVPMQTKASIAVWVKSPSVKGYRVFISTSGSGLFFAQQNNQYYGAESISSLGGLGCAIYPFGADNQWHHLAVTYDGVNIRVYGDGALSGTVPFAGSFAQYLAEYHLGYSPGVAGFWNGCLDDLRFYNITLSASQIQSMASM